MKKIFTFLMAFLATLSGAVWGQGYDATLDISGSSATVSGSGISVSGNHIDISGDGNYLIKGDGSARDFYIDVHNEPTITLENVNLSHDGDPIIDINRLGEVSQVYVTLILEGENVFSGNDVGIYNTEETNVEFADGSTGSLTFRTKYGIANDIGRCGNINMNGGTIIFETTDHAIYSWSDIVLQHRIKINGNAVVITNKSFDGIPFDTKDDITKGIFFDNSAQDKTGYMYDNVTLNSPLDLTDESLSHLNLQKGTLTIGNGRVLKANANDIQNGSVVGFAIKYEENRIEGCTNAGGLSSDYNFYGEGAKVVLPAALTCSTEATSQYGNHQFLGWADASKVTAAESEYTTGTTANTYTANTSGEITGDYLTLKGAWAVNELTLNVPNNTAMIDRELVAKPDFISYESVSEGLPSGLSFDNNTFSGTPNVTFEDDKTTKTFTVNVPIKKGTGVAENTTAKVTIVVSRDKPDLSKATVSVSSDASSYVYNNDVKNPLIVKVEGLETPLVEGRHYTVTYNYKVNEKATETSEVTEVKEAGVYTVKSIESTTLTQGNVADVSSLSAITVSPRTLNVTVQDKAVEVGGEMPALDATIIKVTDDASNVNDYWAKDQTKAAITFSGTWNPAAVPALAGKYTLTTTDLSIASVTSEGDQTHNYKLGNITPGVLTVSNSGDEDDLITPGTPDEDGDDDDVIIRVKGWEVEDGAYQHVYTGDVFDATSLELEAKQVMEDGSIDWYSIPENAITNIAIESYEVGGSSATATEVKNAGSYSLEITLDASKAEGLLYDGVVSSLPVRITPRDLSINFPLDDITEEQIGKELNPNDLYWEDETKDIEDAGLVKNEGPEFSGYIRIAGTANEDGKYDVYYKLDIEDKGTADFLKINYNPSVSINDTEITLGEEGETQLPGEGIEVDSDDDDDNMGGGIISTKRYRLYLANQDYLNTGEYKKYYDELGLVLYSRHNQKYTTNTDKSFTIWYEQDGEVNAGGFRVFMSNHANGEYKEVKLDDVSGYYQIRNVTSNVYVKLCWLNGHPVANEEITATDARAYAQANKIVVITPEPTDVQIISMAGAVVATDQVTGQREFANLAEGVYIVRMGETVIKLQVRN